MDALPVSPEKITCPACDSPVQPGQSESAICGFDLTEMILAMKPAKEAEQEIKAGAQEPIQDHTGLLEGYQNLLVQAQTYDQANDLVTALAAYQRTLTFAREHRQADLSLDLAVQTLELLVKRTGQMPLSIQQSRQILDLLVKRIGQLKAQKVLPGVVTTRAIVEPVGAPGTRPNLEPVKPAKPEEILSRETPAVPGIGPSSVLEIGIGKTLPAQPAAQPVLPKAQPVAVAPAPRPSPARPKRDGKKLTGIRVGAILLLSLGCMVIGNALLGGGFPKLPSFNTRTPTLTPTNRPTSTPSTTPTFTPTFTPNPLWEVNVYEPFDTDDFAFPHKVDETGECGTENMQVKGGKLVWDVKDTTDCFWTELANQGTIGDFSFFMDAQRLSGGSDSDFGIVFRAQGDNLYFFGISDVNNVFLFSILQENSWTNLGDWESNYAIQTGGVNRIGVICYGDAYDFYINDILVGSYVDDTLTSGAIGVAAEPRGSGIEMSLEFDNFELGWSPHGQSSH